MPKRNRSDNEENENNHKVMIILNDNFCNNSESECEYTPPTPKKVNTKLVCNKSDCPHNIRKKIKLPTIEKITNIQDLIDLANTYHCKQNLEYKGINLHLLYKILPNLIELNNMIGLTNIKKDIINQILYFTRDKSLKCNNCAYCVKNMACPKNKQHMLHVVITGSPGTGKTTFGAILGRLFKNMGVLSNGTFHEVGRNDLIGEFLGSTAIKTQRIINKCSGGVMFIDEAYSLGHKRQDDSFAKECIDVLNKNLSEKLDFMCIIAGYRQELDECFFKMNPGLERRFNFSYNIEGYTKKELYNIFMNKLKNSNWIYSIEEKTFDVFKKYEYKNYGGDMENLLVKCKMLATTNLIDNKIIINDNILIEALQTYNEKNNEKNNITNNLIKHMYI